MDYREFKDKHKGGKIIVSGCGVSASDLTNPKDFVTIGVNDLSRLYHPNYLVVVNDKSSFEHDRWKWIESTEATHIFTHIKTLAVDEARRVLLQLGRYGGADLEKDAVDYTSNSTYVACIIAAYMGATKIGLLGCDFVPDHFFAKTGEHTLAKRVNSINTEYAQLKIATDRKGIELVNLSTVSKIESLPKQKIEDF
jgi:hypothetical protein